MTGTNTKDAKIVVATQDFIFGPHGFVIQQGERRRADDEAVLAAPDLWVDDGTPPGEWGTVYDDSVRRIDEASAAANERRIDQAKRNKVKLGVAMFEATRDILDVDHGRTIAKGSRVLDGDPALTVDADAWKERT